jgi:hypothetical protein
VLEGCVNGRTDGRNCEVGEQRCDVWRGIVRVGARRRVVLAGEVDEREGNAEEEEVEEEEINIEGEKEGQKGKGKKQERERRRAVEVDLEYEAAVGGPNKADEADGSYMAKEAKKADETDEAKKAEARERAEEEVIAEKGAMERIRRGHKRQEGRQRERAMEEVKADGALVEEYGFWQRQCEICQINGRASVGQESWRDCRVGEADGERGADCH